MQKMGKRKEKRKPGILLFNMYVYLIWISTSKYHNNGIFIQYTVVYQVQYSLFIVTCFSLVEEKSLESDTATLTIEDKLVSFSLVEEKSLESDTATLTIEDKLVRGEVLEKNGGIQEYFLIVGPPPPLLEPLFPKIKCGLFCILGPWDYFWFS